MVIKITDQMLNVITDGRTAPYTLENVNRARRFLRETGVSDDIELHPLEVEKLRMLHAQRRAIDTGIKAFLELGPVPACMCTLNGDGTVESSSGCPLGCRVGETPRTLEG